MSGDVVVVDDEPGTLKLLKTLLEIDGYEVRAFTSGALALRSIKVKAPDLALLDIRMPGVSGFDLCRGLKADPATAGIPVIFLSAATDIDDKIAAFAVGGVDYITKPFDKAEVLARVGTHVSLTRSQLEVARYKQLIETSTVGTVLSNLDGTTAALNQAMCDLTGFDMDTAMQMSWTQAIPEPHLHTLLGVADDLVAGRIASYRGEHMIIHADGTARWIDMSLSVMRTRVGQPEYLIIQSVDITAAVQAREELEAARRLMAANADSMLDPQVLLEAVRNPEGRVVDFRFIAANRATYLYLQVDEADLIGSMALDNLPNLEGSGLLARYAQCLEDGQPVIVSDFSYFNEMLDDARRYDIRATRAGPNLLSLTWTDVTDRFQAAQRDLAAQTLLRASVDSMLNPQTLLEAVRDNAGQVVDFVYRSVNRAFCSYRGSEEQDIIGTSLLQAQPDLAVTGLFDRYVHCVETGESVVLDDFGLYNAILADDRRFDIRVVRAGVDLISLTFSDVTERYQAARRIADSEQQYRLLAENATDVIVHARGGTVVWVSPSVRDVLGAPDTYWVGRQIQEVSPPEDAPHFARRVATLASGGTVKERVRVVSLDGVTHWISLRARPFYDDTGHEDGYLYSLRVIDDEVAAEQTAAKARRDQARADALYRRSVDSAAVGMCLADLEGNFVEVNKALCEFFGYDADTLQQMTWQELTDPEYLEADLANRAQVLAGEIESYRMVKKFIDADGHPIWGDLAVSCIRDDDGRVEMFIGQITDITAEVEAQQAVARYKQVIEQSNIGINVVRPDGPVLWINQAMCDMFGLDVATAMQKTWQEMTPAENLENNLHLVEDLIAGRTDVVRATQYYIHADGHKFWVDVSVSCLRDSHERPEYIFTQMLDITAEVQAREQLVASEERNRELAQGLQAELDSAAKYVRAVLPDDLAGQVSVSTRYLPSNTLGGDCFDFYWIDDDHLVVYLLDVSGHGVESALIAVSVHNMLRSDAVTIETLLEPEHVLATLNSQFAMERHDDNYFTLFYAVYQQSSATLRYSNAGHPPALLFTGGQVTELSSQSMPVGMFDHAEFRSTTVPVPAGSQLLVVSDGTYEVPLGDGGQRSLEDFVDTCTRLAESPDWSLDDVIDNARHHSAIGGFTDDCCLMRLKFHRQW